MRLFRGPEEPGIYLGYTETQVVCPLRPMIRTLRPTENVIITRHTTNRQNSSFIIFADCLAFIKSWVEEKEIWVPQNHEAILGTCYIMYIYTLTP